MTPIDPKTIQSFLPLTSLLLGSAFAGKAKGKAKGMAGMVGAALPMLAYLGASQYGQTRPDFMGGAFYKPQPTPAYWQAPVTPEQQGYAPFDFLMSQPDLRT